MLTIKAMIFEREIMLSSEHNIIIIAVSLQAILGMAYVIKKFRTSGMDARPCRITCSF